MSERAEYDTVKLAAIAGSLALHDPHVEHDVLYRNLGRLADEFERQGYPGFAEQARAYADKHSLDDRLTIDRRGDKIEIRLGY